MCSVAVPAACAGAGAASLCVAATITHGTCYQTCDQCALTAPCSAAAAASFLQDASVVDSEEVDEEASEADEDEEEGLSWEELEEEAKR